MAWWPSFSHCSPPTAGRYLDGGEIKVSFRFRGSLTHQTDAVRVEIKSDGLGLTSSIEHRDGHQQSPSMKGWLKKRLEAISGSGSFKLPFEAPIRQLLRLPLLGMPMMWATAKSHEAPLRPSGQNATKPQEAITKPEARTPKVNPLSP